jgi:hypothetical protein
MKRINLKLSTRDEIDEVKAWKVNPVFAVHKSPEGLDWTITHIPSGMKMGTPILRKRAEAVQRANAILQDVEQVAPAFNWIGENYEALKLLNRHEDFHKVMQVARKAVYGQ